MTDSQNREPIKAVLCDIDGTLVDSNYAHIAAWSRALVEVGAPVDEWRIHRCIGMDSGKLIATLLGDRADELGDRAKELHSAYYLEEAESLRPLGGARELVTALAGRGIQVVFATSAPEEELEILLEILDVDGSVAATTSSGDVDAAKPDPDILQVALEKVGIDPWNAVMLGDSAWDMRSAAAAGVVSVGLRSGGMGAAELLEAGATAVYDDAAALLEDLDSSPLIEPWGVVASH
jgi:HAD superfamily hydrolase (TIGR01509 family)